MHTVNETGVTGWTRQTIRLKPTLHQESAGDDINEGELVRWLNTIQQDQLE